MDFHVNQATNQFVRGRGLNAVVTSAGMKARDTLRLDVYFNDGGTALVDLAEGAMLVFAIKTSVESDAVLLAQVTEWTQIDTGHYRAWLPLNTEPLVEAIGDLASISAVGELTWQENPEGGGWESTNTLAVRIYNDVYKGTEGTPLELPTPEAWLAARAVALPLYRAAHQGPPNVPVLRVTGDIEGPDGPVVFPSDIAYRRNLYGKESYADSNGSPTYACGWDGTWYLQGTDGVTSREWRSDEDVATPDLVEVWTPDSGTTGTPIVVRHITVSASTPGQWLFFGDETPYRHFIATEVGPTVWDEITPGLIKNRDTLATERLFVEDGILQTEVVSD